MKQKLLLLLTMLLWSFGTNLVLADEPNVVVVENLKDYTGEDLYIFNQADGKVYVRNNVGEYERYGIVETAPVLKVAGGGDTEIEYIESKTDGDHPYINTGYIHKANTRVVAELKITENSVKDWEAIFGARNGNWTSHAFVFFHRTGKDGAGNAGCYNRSGDEHPGNEVLPMGEEEKLIMDCFENTASFSFPGDEEPWIEIYAEGTVDDGVNSMYIFDLNTANEGGNRRDNSWGFFKLYSFKIYEGETLMMDFVPIVASTGEAGLKDKLTGKKYMPVEGHFAVSPDGEKLIGEAGVTVYEGKMFFNPTDNMVYKYTNGEFKSLGGRTLTPIEFEDYKYMGNWRTNDSHMAIFFGDNGCYWYDEEKDINIFEGYSGTAYHEPLMIQIPTVENEDYNFSFGFNCDPYESWHNTPMHVFVTNKYDLGMTETGGSVGGDILATYECPFAGTDLNEVVPVSLDFTAQQEMETLVAQFGDVEDGRDYYFEFHKLVVSKYGYPEAYPVLNPFAPQLALLIPEAEAFEGNMTPAAKTLLAEAIAAAKAVQDSEDLLAQRAALENLQKVFAQVRSVNIKPLEDMIEYAKAVGVDVTAAITATQEAVTANEVNEALIALTGLCKVKASTMKDVYTGAAPEADGEYYFFNIGTGLFLSMGSDWNTHAAADQAGWPVSLQAVEGGYTLHTWYGLYNEDGTPLLRSFNASPYVDTGVNSVYTFQMVEGKENVYNILQGENLLGWNPGGHTDGKHYWSSFSNTAGADPADPYFQWKFVTRAEREALMEQASVDNPVEVSFLMENPSLLKLPGLDMWDKIADGGNGGARISTNTDGDGGRAMDFGYEFWNTESFTFSQILEDLKPGLYEVSVDAFYRDGDGGYQASVVNQGGQLLRHAYLFANDEQTPLVSIANSSIFGTVPPSIATQPSDKGNIVNWPNEALEYFQYGFYNNKVQVIVGADGILEFGIEKLEKSNYGDWVVLDNFRLTYLGEPVQMQKDVLVDRYTGQGYGVTEAKVDLAPAKKFLGVDDLSTAKLTIVNPDGTQVADYATYDGWFNVKGEAETWSALNAEPETADKAGICVKFFQAIPDGKYEICDMNGADKAGESYFVKWALSANNLTYIYNIELAFSNKPSSDLTFDKLNVVGEETVAFNSELGKCYEGLTADVDVPAILSKLGVASLDDVVIYAVQPDGSLDDNYKLGTTDGWRNAEGAWQGWGPDARFYVKVDFTRESTQIYEVGGMDGQNTEEPVTYTARYAFVKAESTDAVILSVTLTYETPSGLQDITSDKETVIFDLMGRKVNRTQKGLYIVNGRKAAVK